MTSSHILRIGAGILAGVWAYCLLIAPLFDARPYTVAAGAVATEVGIGFSIVVVVLTGLGAAVVAWRRRGSRAEAGADGSRKP